MQEYSAAPAPAQPAAELPGTELPGTELPGTGGPERGRAAACESARPRPGGEDAPGPAARGGGDAAQKEGERDALPRAEGDGPQPGTPDPGRAALLAELLAASRRRAADGTPVPGMPGMPGAEDPVRRELEGYRQREHARLFSDDLAAIRAAHPEESARSVAELGPQFLAICASGVDPLCAYEAVRADRQRSAPPPSTGEFGGEAPPKEFFTRDEVARMDRGEIRRNFDKIRRSMSHWNF